MVIGKELRRVRLRRRFKVRELVVPGQLSASTIRNNEKGRHSAGLEALALHCHAFEALVMAAVRRWGR